MDRFPPHKPMRRTTASGARTTVRQHLGRPALSVRHRRFQHRRDVGAIGTVQSGAGIPAEGGNVVAVAPSVMSRMTTAVRYIAGLMKPTAPLRAALIRAISPGRSALSRQVRGPRGWRKQPRGEA